MNNRKTCQTVYNQAVMSDSHQRAEKTQKHATATQKKNNKIFYKL